MGPWDGNLDTTWDLSTINYTVYDDEPGQLPINTANPKYVSTKLPINPQGYVIPPGPPPAQDYEYEEGECLPNGALADGYAVHYFKHSHYMGAGQASNNYRAITSDGVTYDYNRPQQPYLNGIMYRQQYGNYVANNPTHRVLLIVDAIIITSNASTSNRSMTRLFRSNKIDTSTHFINMPSQQKRSCHLHTASGIKGSSR